MLPCPCCVVARKPGAHALRLRHREIARRATKIGDQLDRAAFSATWLKLHAQEIADRANSDMDDGINSGSYGARSSDVSTPTERKALATLPTEKPDGTIIPGRRDEVARMVMAMVNALVEADRLTRKAELIMQNAERAGRWLVAMDREQARKLAETEQIKNDPKDETRSTTCANPNCQRVVSRTPNDRLRGGRCDACRMYLVRTQQERPRHLCALGDDVLSTDGLGLDESRLIVSPVREDGNKGTCRSRIP